MKYPVFKSLLEACGYCEVIAPDYVPSFGGIVRARTEKNPRKKNGYLISLADGSILVGNYELDELKAIYSEKGISSLSPAERACLKLKIQQERWQQRAKIQQTHEKTAIQALHFIQECCTEYAFNNPHPYCLNKQIQPPEGSVLETTSDKYSNFFFNKAQRGRAERLLVIPLSNGKKLTSLQFIGEDGRKTFLKGGKIQGSYWIAQNSFSTEGTDSLIVIAEGVATLVSVIQRKENFNGIAVAAMNCNNLEPVAKNLHAKYPRTLILILADNDKNGTGIKGALKAKKSVRLCEIRAPEFTPKAINQFKQITGTHKEPTDWNDFYILKNGGFSYED